ncbi:MAG: carbon-nitrogen hydrolase family protein, partial [Bacteroidales bacterium]|nr:carbon-nitrogen hydrolase family protein [Bacteroidales bacterium]
MKEIIDLKYYYSKLLFTSLIVTLALNMGVGKIYAQQFEYIDLSKYVNQSFTDEQADDGKGGWADFGKYACFHKLPLEISTFDDGIVPFKIINPEKNKGKSALFLSGPHREELFPRVSKQIKVDAKFEFLFFLHTCMYVSKNSKELVKYKIHYADETEELFICNNNIEIADWWEPSEFLPKAKRTYGEEHKWLINTPWKNPHPQKSIDWIEMQSTGNAIPILIAISGTNNPEPYTNLVGQIDSNLNQYELSNIKFALLQIRSQPDTKWNLEKGTEFCRDAAKSNADIALFPELYNIGYSSIDFEQPDALKKWKGMAITQDSEFVKHFRSLAKELNMAIVITYLEDIGDDKLPRNSASLIDRHGDMVFTYAKIHTTDFSHLENSTTPGDDFYVKELDTKAGAIKVGMMICYDREFPESARSLMLKGAEVILTPNACVLEELRLSQFRVRAMENGVATVMTNYSLEGNEN